MARRTKRDDIAPLEPVVHAPPEIIPPSVSPLVGLTYEEVIDTLVERINGIFVDSDCTLQDAKVAVDAFKDQVLAMTANAEGPRAAQELAFQFMQGCMPYLCNPELEDDPRASFRSILETVRTSLEKE